MQNSVLKYITPEEYLAREEAAEGKSEYYRGIPSLQEYVLIDQYSIHLEQYYLEAPPKWVLSEYQQLADTLKFKKIDFQISLKDLYQRVVIKDSAEGLWHGAWGKAHGA